MNGDRNISAVYLLELVSFLGIQMMYFIRYCIGQLNLEKKNFNSSVFWKKVGFLVVASQLEFMLVSDNYL